MDVNPQVVVHNRDFIVVERYIDCTANHLLDLLLDNIVEVLSKLPL